MKIYQQEINDGITNVAQASVIQVPIKFDLFAQASTDTHLYPIKSVLVSTGWNKNDDVFDKLEVWNARHTPVNQKINFEHDELVIIGHITNAFAFSDDGPIDDVLPQDDLPDKYHLFTEGYLYTFWQNPERAALINKIIAEIPDDKWFVSMECVFDNFDYAVRKDGQDFILKRDETTAFLSKHLRIYNGTGEYQGYQIGRVLRDFTFSGKGIVSKPANPDSVILDPDDFLGEEINFIDFASSSVSTIKKENDMGDKLDELVEAKSKIKELEAQLANKDLESQTAKASELDGQITQLNKELATASCENSTLQQKLSATEQALQSLQEELAEAKRQSEVATKEKEEMSKKAKCSQRAMKLVEAGLTETDAAEKAEKWVDVAEEVFADYVVAVKGKKEDKKTEASVEQVASEVIDGTKTEDTAISTETHEDDTLMKSIAKYFETELAKNKTKKESK